MAKPTAYTDAELRRRLKGQYKGPALPTAGSGVPDSPGAALQKSMGTGGGPSQGDLLGFIKSVQRPGDSSGVNYQGPASPAQMAVPQIMSGLPMKWQETGGVVKDANGNDVAERILVPDPEFFKSKISPALEKEIEAARREPLELDLTGLADFVNFTNTSGRKVSAQPSKHTADARTNKVLSLQKMLQEESDKEAEKHLKLLSTIAPMQDIRWGVTKAERHQPGGGSGVEDRFIQRQVTALNKQLNPKALATAKVKLQKVHGLIGGFDPADSKPIPGVGQWGMGKIEAMNPFDKDHVNAQATRAAVLDAVADIRHQLYGSAQTRQEAENFINQTGLNVWGDPAVLRSFMKSQTDALAAKIEMDRSGFGPEVIDYYDKNPGASRPEDFDVSTWQSEFPSAKSTPKAAAAGVQAQANTPKQLSPEQKAKVDALRKTNPAGAKRMEELYLK